MYPTYHGMTSEVFSLNEDGPKGLKKGWRKLTQMTERIEARAPTPGEVWIPLDSSEHPAHRSDEDFDNGLFGTGLFRSPLDVYYLTVGVAPRQTPVEVPVPKEFKLLNVVLGTYFPDEAKRRDLHEEERWQLVLRNARDRGDIVPNEFGGVSLRTRKRVTAGARVAHFDVLTGDMVLVDRMSYNFVRPKAGDPFVFATKNISGLNKSGEPQDLYFIKRLVGTPGDTLRVADPVLLRNGTPISGKPAFEKNNTRRTDLEYYGYRPSGGSRTAFLLHEPHTLPPGDYFAMGDNSSGSHDSRGWGHVPEKEIIGRGFFILYPFTNRWGAAE
jgi:signal peptidase I